MIGLTVGVRELLGCRIITASGDLDISTQRQLAPHLEYQGGLIVDLSGIEFIDSRALKMLEEGIKNNEGKILFVFKKSNGTVERILEITGLGDLLPRASSLEEALNILGKDSSLSSAG